MFRTIVLGLDPGPSVLDKRITQTFDDQMKRGLFEEILQLADRYHLDDEMARGDSTNQVLHTHGYREFFELAFEQRKRAQDLKAREIAIVRDRILDHIQAYSRRQRGWFAKLPDLHRTSNADEAFEAVARVLRS